MKICRVIIEMPSILIYTMGRRHKKVFPGEMCAKMTKMWKCGPNFVRNESFVFRMKYVLKLFELASDIG